MQQIVQAIEKLSVSQPKKKRRGRRRGRSTLSVPGGILTRPLPTSPTMVSSSDGLRVRHMEFFKTVSSTTTGLATFKFDFKSPVLLASIAKVYTRAVIHAMSIYYRPSVGTTKDGQIYIAVDWESSDAPTVAQVKVMQPQIRQPVWGEGQMVLPQARLQEKRNLRIATDVPYQLAVTMPASQSEDYGEILISYDITLMGPSGN